MSLLQPSPSILDNDAPLSEVTATTLSPVWRRWTRLSSARMGWGVYTLLCFAVFLFLTFPVDVVLQRVISSVTRGTPVHIHYSQGELTWYGAALVRDVRVEQRGASLPPLRVSRLLVHPSWLGLLWGSPFPLAFQADLYGGTINGTAEHSPNGVKTTLTARRMNLALLPIPGAEKSGGLKGILTGSGEVSGDFSQIFSLQGALELNVSEGSLQPGALGQLPVPPLQSVRGNLRANLRDGRVNITDVTLMVDGIEARAQGALVLSTPLPRSGLDLQLTTKVVGPAPPALTALVSLLPISPNTPGERRATISGSLAAPVMR